MASYHQKILNTKPEPTKSRHSKVLISFDDPIDQDDQPNVFTEPKIQSAEKVSQIKKSSDQKRQTPARVIRTESEVQLKNKKQNSSRLLPKLNKSPKIEKIEVKNPIKEPERKLQVIDDQYVDQESNSQAQVHGVSRKSWLSLFESVNLLLGQFFYTYQFPIRREIPIIANNLDLEREKYQNGTYISESFDNNLQVSFALFFLRTCVVQNFLRLSVLLWIIAVVLSFVISKNEQYRPGCQILLGLLVFYCFFTIILQFFALKNRRNWTEPSGNLKYKVYHYDNELRNAQWILTDVSDLRPGNIYKVPIPTEANPSVIPADSILLHGPCTIVQADQSSIIEYLSPMEKQQNISLKQTVLKSDVVLLPLTGVIHYELAAPQILEENIYGKFLLQEPTKQTYNITYNNVMLRGTRLLSSSTVLLESSNKKSEKGQSSILAVVLQTGIDSLILKTCQYPYQFRKQYSINKLIDLVLIFCSIFYLVLVGSGILIGYIYLASSSVKKGYYIQDYLDLGETPVTLPQIVLHHFGNVIMVVPILLRVSYLIYVNIIGRRVSKNLNIEIKDAHILAEAGEPEILVTTIASDLVRMDNGKNQLEQGLNQEVFFNLQQARSMIRNRSLQSVRVGGIHHNFLTTRIDNDMYSTKDIDMICYFMSLALLTCNRKNPTPLERGVIQRCNKEFKLKAEKFGKIVKIGQLRVLQIMSIPSTEKYPYKINFYKHGKDIVEDLQNPKLDPKQKILCLIRGDTGHISPKINETDGRILNEFSSKLHQEKGLHIEFLGKFVLAYDQFLQVKKAYVSSQRERDSQSKAYNGNESRTSSIGRGLKYGIEKFYQHLDRYMSKVDGMGLLIWENPYNILGKNLLPISSMYEIEYKIIIAPPSRSQTDPEFESIHAITNYLLKSSNLTLKQISNKILHHYSNKETFWTVLEREKLIVLNGWDYRTIKKMLTQLKEIKRSNKKAIKMLGYIEQDQYAWILKQTDLSITTKGDGHDLQKYSDILIQKNSSQTTKDIIRFILLNSRAYACNTNGIIIIHFIKSILLFTVQFIYFFYTWGSGLVLIGSPLYLILEAGLLLDFLYYLFPKINEETNNEGERGMKKNQQKNEDKSKKMQNQITLEYMLIQLCSSVVIGIFLTFISLYSLTEPATVNGTTEPKQFTHVLIHFILYHILVLRKIFIRPYTMSVYRLFILLVQIGIYYIGLLIVSAVDYYQYKGVIWYALEGKVILAGIFMVWMILGVYWLAFMIQTIMNSKLKPLKNAYIKVNERNLKKDEDASSNQKETIQMEQPIDID